ncbi:MAG: T9SS type A sorting domain-containing protein, partial [bacterium]
SVPERFELFQNYPNPFNPSTTIKYELSKNSQVILKIYNVLGREVRTLLNENQTAGLKTVQWDGRDDSGAIVSSGVYLYRIQASNKIQSKKMVFLR